MAKGLSTTTSLPQRRRSPVAPCRGPPEPTMNSPGAMETSSGQVVAVPENQPFLLLRISKIWLFNYRRGIFQAREIGNWHSRRRYLLCHRCGLFSYWNWLGLRFYSGRCCLHFRLGRGLRFNISRGTACTSAWGSGSGSTAAGVICSSGLGLVREQAQSRSRLAGSCLRFEFCRSLLNSRTFLWRPHQAPAVAGLQRPRPDRFWFPFRAAPAT